MKILDQKSQIEIAAGLVDLDKCEKIRAFQDEKIRQMLSESDSRHDWKSDSNLVVDGLILSFLAGGIVGALIIKK